MLGEVDCAITGKAMRYLLNGGDQQDTLEAILRRACVFARMSPEDKRDLVQLLGQGMAPLYPSLPPYPNLGLNVAFCGDGANDMGALRVAHVGVALGEGDALVVAPFTSKSPSIGAVTSVIMEGRNAATSLQHIYQFMVTYGIIQVGR